MQGCPSDILTLVVQDLPDSIGDHSWTSSFEGFHLIESKLTQSDPFPAGDVLQITHDSLNGSLKDGVARFGHQRPLAQTNWADEHLVGVVVVFDADNRIDRTGPQVYGNPPVWMNEIGRVDVTVDTSYREHDQVPQEVCLEDRGVQFLPEIDNRGPRREVFLNECLSIGFCNRLVFCQCHYHEVYHSRFYVRNF